MDLTKRWKDFEEIREKLKVVLIPGSAVGDPSKYMWYPYISEELGKLGYPSVLMPFPDPLWAKEDIWKPFALEKLQVNEKTILIGHSSGAVCSMRIMEEHKVLGCILVAAYASDLNNDYESKSGYFSRPWKWDNIRNNAQWILQFHGIDDPLVPIEEGREVAKQLQSEYHEFEGVSHFHRIEQVPQILQVIKKKLDTS